MSRTDAVAARLHEEVIQPLKHRFVGRDEAIDLIALALVAREHLFLHGPPGTAKSALIRCFAQAVRGTYFEYMLTRFSEPNEIFGPIDIGKLREGTIVTVTKGMLPEAEFVFLDELFNANSAILNNLLTVLNERVYRRGMETHALPLLSVFSASNHLPEDETLNALFDRFLLRCHVENLKPEAMAELLHAGWALERDAPLTSTLTTGDLGELHQAALRVSLGPAEEAYREAVLKIRDLGIAYSDRRAVKVMKLLAASAVLCGRDCAQPSDLWVLRYVWDREEQIEPLRSLVQRILEVHQEEEKRHPLSGVGKAVDAEQLARQIETAAGEINGTLSLAALSRLRERLADLADQATWVTDPQSRDHLLNRIRHCLQQLK
jgi:MoxR-like ATPase